ncbi:MAG: phosphoribosylanthranilate isomerase [Pseudomonadota bacterium]
MRDDPIKVKICGLTRPDDVSVAIASGANYLGFNFFPGSPRYIDQATGAQLAALVPPDVTRVALTVDADTATLDALTGTVPVDMLQLHGSETPERVREVKARYDLPVMKVIGISTADDVLLLDTYAGVADQLLVDAKPPKGANRPGGNAVAFDWSLITTRAWTMPWLLAGGLTPENVAGAIRQTGARQVDVASGVESAPGLKDPGRMRAFIDAARA